MTSLQTQCVAIALFYLLQWSIQSNSFPGIPVSPNPTVVKFILLAYKQYISKWSALPIWGMSLIKFISLRGATALLVAVLQPVASRWTRKLQLIPINAHVTWGPCSVCIGTRSIESAMPGVQREDKNLLQALTTSTVRWVSACERQWTTAITPVWSESLWGLRIAVLATNFEKSDRAMAADGTTKAVVSLQPWWVSAPKLCGWVAAW